MQYWRIYEMKEEKRDTLIKRLDRIEQAVYRIEDNSIADHFLALLHIVEHVLRDLEVSE